MEVELVKFNRGRMPAYRTETSIVREDGERFVRKRPLVPEAEEHVLSLIRKFEILHGLEGVRAHRPHHHGGRMVLAYVEGTSFESLMLERLSRGDRGGFRAMLDRFLALMRSFGTTRTKEFRPGRELSRIFPEGFVRYDEPCLRITDMDLTFDNLIIDHNDDVWVTDYEWVFDEPVPLSFIVFRSLYVFLLRRSDRLHGIDERELMSWAKLDPEMCGTYRQACERFVDLVHGKDRPYMVPDVYRKKVHSLGPGEELSDSMAHLAQARDELGSAYGMLKGREVEITNLRSALVEVEESVRRKEVELALVQRSLMQQNDHIAVLDRQMIERDRTIERDSQKLRQCVEETSQYQAQLDRTLTLHKEEITKMQLLFEANVQLYAEEVEALYRMLSDQRITIEADLVKFKEMSDSLERKQKELMTMSDWAYGMKQRLEFIDSSPSVLRAERRARLFREVKGTYKADGISGLFKGFLRRYRPGWATHGHVHEVPADLLELSKNVMANRGKLLVVFPIIPWEFRWQRPQQIVSRFAKDGSTVLFLNMSLTPKGRRFENDEDAGKDVKIGKLDDNIYQVWLSTENRLNVYQDRISDGDLSNLLHGLKFVLEGVDADLIIFAVQFPGWADLVLALRKKVKGKLIFDCMDEHSGFSNNTEAVLRDEEKLLRQSDLVVTTSNKLHAKAKKQNENVVMVRNGTDFEFFNELAPNGELDKVKRPIIGYYGAISDWFDIGIIESCAKDHPEWNIVLIGSTVGCDVGSIDKLPNVKLLGEKPYKTLPGYLSYFDVCIIPFKINPLTLATNPVKFYEYLSSGKPVVSVPLPELLDFKEICYLADGAREFGAQVERALKEYDPEMVARRIQFARENSWDDRYKRIKRALDDI